MGRKWQIAIRAATMLSVFRSAPSLRAKRSHPDMVP
jgi:hypothetical protein